MASTATYTLLPGELRTIEATGEEYPTGGRTAWIVRVDTAQITGTFAAVIEARVGEALWREALREDISAVGRRTFSTGAMDFFVYPYETEIRASFQSIGGDYYAAATAEGPFLNMAPSSLDSQVLSQRLREYEGGVVRLVEEAEDDVLNRPQMRRESDGRLAGLDMSDPRFLDQMQLAIARQAERRFAIQQLRAAASTNPSAAEELAKLSTVTAEVDQILGPFYIVTAAEATAEDWARYSGAR